MPPRVQERADALVKRRGLVRPPPPGGVELLGEAQYIRIVGPREEVVIMLAKGAGLGQRRRDPAFGLFDSQFRQIR